MFKSVLLSGSFILLFIIRSFSQAGFIAPDTVCVNTTFTIQNTSAGASTYFWNFCSGSLYGTPLLTSLGNVGGMLNIPTFMVTVKDGSNYYGFISNFGASSLLRLDFGTSMLNTPKVTNLGNVDGKIPPNTEGLQVVKDADGWHVIIVGGASPDAACILKIDFGASITNPKPTATNWGNIGNLNYPVDLYLFQDNGKWYGLTVNFFNNTITRFAFGTNFRNAPVGTNFGNLGNVDHPTGIYAIQENANWYVFITNETGSTISRLDFGNSLVNMPTGINLGNPGGVLNGPRDLCIIHDCGNIFALAINHFSNDLVRLDFNADITSNASGVSLGNAGNLSFPHSISTIFREGNSLYAFITSVDNGTIARLEFNSCNNSSIASTKQAVAPPILYNTPGNYTVHLLTNESLPSQSAFCKNIVVMPEIKPNLGADRELCSGSVLPLDAGPGATHYLWNTGATTRTIIAATSGTYSVTVSNGACTGTSSMKLKIADPLVLNTPVVTNIDCGVIGKIQMHPSGGTAPYTYYINGISGNAVFTTRDAGNYLIKVVDANNCEATTIVPITENTPAIIRAAASSNAPTCHNRTDGNISVRILKGVPPFEYAVKGQAFQALSSFTDLAQGTYRIYIRNAVCIDSVEVTLIAPDRFKIGVDPYNEICERGNGRITFMPRGGTAPYDIYWDNTLVTSPEIRGLSTGTYSLTGMDVNGCSVDTTIDIRNVIIPPVHIMNHDTIINIGDIFQLNAVNAVDYSWTPVDGLSCTNCSSPFARPLKPVTYIVNTVTGINCIPADTITITLTYNRFLHAPNAFSPNGDGQNDLFHVKVKGVALYRLFVYNRSGQLIFESNDMNTGWNGYYKNEPQSVGGYVYMVQYAFYGDETNVLMQKGTFTLVR
jgi:gliding motility-associated-like protein